jgi:hypothetical protein
MFSSVHVCKNIIDFFSSVNKGFLFWGVHRETVLQFINKIDRLLHSNLVKLMKLNSIVKQ